MTTTATHINRQAFTAPANTDLSTKQYYAVSINSSGEAVVAGAASVKPYILGNKPSVAGQPAEVIYSGVCPVVCGGTVAAGDSVKTDSAGKIVAASSTNASIGVALTGGASGEQANVNLFAHVAA
jgi:hypothetical protein